jgi:hypothetical protein
MRFLSDFKAASKGMLEEAAQEAALKYGKRGAKSEWKE